jgi:hypothetical protein
VVKPNVIVADKALVDRLLSCSGDSALRRDILGFNSTNEEKCWHT